MNILAIGAHPDDAEFYAGGTLLKWVEVGHSVWVVSLTNGDIGHHEMAGGALAQRRAVEAATSANRGGFHHRVLDFHDGELCNTLETRKAVVRLIRETQADVVLTHRPWDYHPDHRYTAMIVQDAAFMVTVPFFCPDKPALQQNPIFFYMVDEFTKPIPFRADIAVDVSDVMDKKWELLDAMPSQFYEWLPWLDHALDTVPDTSEARKDWLRKRYTPLYQGITEQTRPALQRWYGEARARQATFAEGFEICEYGAQLDEEKIRSLFPFFPSDTEGMRGAALTEKSSIPGRG